MNIRLEGGRFHGYLSTTPAWVRSYFVIGSDDGEQIKYEYRRRALGLVEMTMAILADDVVFDFYDMYGWPCPSPKDGYD